MRRGETTESGADARSMVLSGALARRAAQIERVVGPVGPARWARPGMPLDMSPLIHKLLVDVHRHAEGRRWLAAVRAYEAAEQLLRNSLPTIREARSRALADAEAGRRATLVRQGTEAKRCRKTRRAADYLKAAQQLRARRPNWSLNSIAVHLHEHPPGRRRPVSVRTIARYLRTAGLK
jgi:hypothetical protein